MKPKQPELEQQLRRFLIDELIEDFYDRPYDGEDPLADGAVDSLGIEQLIEHLSEVYGVTLDEEDIVAENFEDIGALAALVDSKC